MPDLLDRRLRQLDRRRRLQRCGERSLRWWLLAGMAACVAILLVRLALPQLTGLVPALAAAAVLAPVLRWPAWWRARDTPARLAGELDLLCRGHGVIMALAADTAANRDPDWYARVATPLADLRWPRLDRSGLGPVLAVLTAIVIAWALPQRRPPPTPTPPGMAVFERTAERLHQLDEAELAPEATRRAFARRLDELRHRATRQGLSQSLWQGHDRLGAAIEAEGRRSARRLVEALAQAERTATGDDTELPARLDELAHRLADLAEQAPGLLDAAAADHQAAMRRLLAQARPGALDAATRRRLQRAGLLTREHGTNGPSPRLDPEAVRRLSRQLAQRLDRAGEGLHALCPPGTLAELRALLEADDAVARGPGHVPLELAHRQAEIATGAEEALPPGAQLNPDGSITLAEQERAPDLDDAALRTLDRARRRRFDAGAADARRNRVAPRHRPAVRRYFARDPAAADPPATAPRLPPEIP